MTEAEFKKHLEAIEKSPKEIAMAVAGLADKVLRAKPAADKWCILEVLGHLADIEIVYGFRLRQIIAGASSLNPATTGADPRESGGPAAAAKDTRAHAALPENQPMIAPIDQDAWARSLGYLEAPAAEFVAGYGLNRHHNVRLLRRLRVDDLEKGGFHPELGRKFTLAELVEGMSGHGAGHLGQIERLKAAR